MITPVKKFTISRKEWLRGETPSASALYRPEDKKMCCVGIYLRKCGVPIKMLRLRHTANDVYRSGVEDIPSWMLEVSSVERTIAHLYYTNDRVGGGEAKREAEITRLFAVQGIEVEFVD